MSDPNPNFPRYPEISAREERERDRPPDEVPESFRDWLRHAWGQLLVLGGFGFLWVLGLVLCLMWAKNPEQAIGLYLFLTLGTVGLGLRAAGLGLFWSGSGGR